MSGDFLLELLTEEIPARMQAGARAELERLFRREMAAAGVAPGALTVWSTPRRLALIARDLPAATAAVSEEIKGPRAGAPPQALEGFLRKTGLAAEQLVERDGVLFAVLERPGRPMHEVLAAAVAAVIRDFAWPKSMRWGEASISTESPRWVRPLSGIVAILGEELVECAAGGVSSAYATRGHRFHCPGPITIGGAHDYQEKLRACHVIVDHEERAAMIRDGAARVAAEAGLRVIPDEGLVIENAGLTEWPVPLLGRFDPAFLDVPPEVIQLTARVNQKYFVCTKPDGSLANAFVCTANVSAADGGAAIVDGNRKVLAARLSDARFFWEQDRKVPLAEHAKKLARITFHEKLGTVADKAKRVAKLARWLVKEGIVTPRMSPRASGDLPRSGANPSPREGGDLPEPGAALPEVPAFAGTQDELADLAEQAARLCKADLVTDMVGEFPELQGVMGGYYARAEGLPDAVADAIRDHYKPVGPGDEVPTAPVTVAVALADKLDTLIWFFAAEMQPTGSKDPFALRRAMIAANGLQTENALRLTGKHFLEAVEVTLEGPLIPVLVKSEWEPGTSPVKSLEIALAKAKLKVRDELLPFAIDRLKVQQRDAGVRHDLIDAVFALGGEDDLVRLLARVHALQAFMATPDGANLLAGYKRAANILKKEGHAGAQGAGGEAATRIPRTGEEDPLVLVDDPQLAPLVAEALAQRRAALLGYEPEPAEAALIAALDDAGPRAERAVDAEDFTAAMAALASLRQPIDAFFDAVTVNDADPAKRRARLDLLARLRAAVHKVADFGRIEG